MVYLQLMLTILPIVVMVNKMLDLTSIIRDPQYQGPPVNIEGIIRSMGIELNKSAELPDQISGQLERLPNDKYKISINKMDHYYRKRFTMAHELGHYILHLHLIGDGVDDNRAYRSTADGIYYNQDIRQEDETEANRFAASILMPEAILREHTQKDFLLEDLARKFQVSVQAMRIRLKGLNIAPPL